MIGETNTDIQTGIWMDINGQVAVISSKMFFFFFFFFFFSAANFFTSCTCSICL